jgi:hypothetical protein
MLQSKAIALVGPREQRFFPLQFHSSFGASCTRAGGAATRRCLAGKTQNSTFFLPSLFPELIIYDALAFGPGLGQ